MKNEIRAIEIRSYKNSVPDVVIYRKVDYAEKLRTAIYLNVTISSFERCFRLAQRLLAKDLVIRGHYHIGRSK